MTLDPAAPPCKEDIPAPEFLHHGLHVLELGLQLVLLMQEAIDLLLQVVAGRQGDLVNVRLVRVLLLQKMQLGL